MQRLVKYGNKAGNSGVTQYGMLDDGSMAIVFRDGSIYVYPLIINQEHVKNMKALGDAGRGLATYIAQKKPMGVKAALIGIAVRTKHQKMG